MRNIQVLQIALTNWNRGQSELLLQILQSLAFKASLHTLKVEIQKYKQTGANGLVAVKELGTLPALTSYSMQLSASKKWDEADIQLFLDQVLALPNLNKLKYGLCRPSSIFLSSNADVSLSGSTPTYQFFNLLSLTRLEKLVLQLFQVNMGEEGAECLFYVLSHLHALRSVKIDLQGNKIKDQGMASISKYLPQMKRLSVLHLCVADNVVSDHGIAFLTASLEQLAGQLTELALRVTKQNKVTSVGLGALCAAVEGLGKVSQLELDLEIPCNTFAPKTESSVTDLVIELANKKI